MPYPIAPAVRSAAAILPVLLAALLLGGCEPRPTPTPDLVRGTALPPPGVTLPAAGH